MPHSLRDTVGRVLENLARSLPAFAADKKPIDNESSVGASNV